MKFLDIKIPFIVVVWIFLIISAGLGIFYWQKIYIPLEAPTPSDISLEADREKCIADVNQMTDEELINQIKELKYPYGKTDTDIVDSDGVLKDRMSWGQNQMSKYLICEVGANPGNEDIYNKAKKFIEESKFEEEYKENKQFYFSMLDQAYSREPTNTFTFKLALGDTDKICPDELPDLCLEAISQFPDDVRIRDSETCRNICNLVGQYSEDQDKLDAEVVNNKEWVSNDFLYGKQYSYRVAMAYRFGGQDLASKICDNVIDSKKDKCLEWIDIINDQKSKVEECNDIQKELEKLICQLPINEIE